MPYIKSISIHHTVNHSIAYILNPNKTEDLLYTTSMNCMTDPVNAYLNMKFVYEHFSGKNFNEPPPLKGKGRVKAIHYIQSFDPADNVSPELAHSMAKAFVKKAFGENCQVVIATHCDKSHTHNHYIINSYGVDGKKFYANKKSLDRLKEYSDRVCHAFGILPYDKRKCKGKTIAYNKWENKKRGTSWKEKIRTAIDSLMGKVKNFDELIYELECQGFTFKFGKNISIKAEGQQRFIRLKTLGDYYAADVLSERIEISLEENKKSDSRNINDLNKIFYKRIYEVSELADNGQKIQRKESSQLPYSSYNDHDVYKMAALLSIINKDNIQSIGELEGKIENLNKEYEDTRQEVNKLSSSLSQFETVLKHIEGYFDLMEKEELSESEQVRFNIYKSTAEKCNVTSRDDIKLIQKLHDDTSEKVKALTEKLDSCKKLHDTYDDIAETYHNISKGDYISNLIAEKKREEEQKKKTAPKKSKGR